MSSSRWKRFAFFDRSALPLPSEVLEEVFFPSSSTSTTTTSSSTPTAGSSSAAASAAIDPKQQPTTNAATAAARGGRGGGGGVEGDAYSLAVCHAPVPLDAARVAGGSSGGSLTGDEDAVVAMARTAGAILPSANSSSGGGSSSSGSGSSSGSSNSHTGGSGSQKGKVTLALFSSRTTDRIHVADLTVRCNPPPSVDDGNRQNRMGGAGAGAGASKVDGGGVSPTEGDVEDRTHLDGYRGSFSPFAYGHVKPPRKAEEIGGTSGGPPGAAGGGDLSRYERSIVAEHMQPGGGSGGAGGGSSGQDNVQASIAGISTCTVSSGSGASASASASSSSGSSRNRPSSSTTTAAASDEYLHVATVTSTPSHTGISVCIDPHLHLSTTSSGSATTSSSPSPSTPYPPSKFYQPSSKFDDSKYGVPTGAVHSLPGLVAVGTSLGHVLIYGYDVGIASGTGAVGGRRQYGHGGTNRLALIMEVPPPPVEAVGGVSSVRLVRSMDGGATAPGGGSGGASFASSTRGGKSDPKAEERTKLYVTYQPVFGGPISPAPSTPRDGPSAASGVCAFDLGVITPQQLASAATSTSISVGRPLARYDLDSRGVTSSALCDVVSVGGGGAAGGAADLTHSATAALLTPTSQGASSASPSLTDHYLIARSEGLVTYSVNDKIGSLPIDGSKVCACWVPPPVTLGRRRQHAQGETAGATPGESGNAHADRQKSSAMDSAVAATASAAAAATAGATHVLISTSDSKSGRDAVDVYDTSHKIIAFHALLSPGHRALRAVGFTGIPPPQPNGGSSYRAGPDHAVSVPRLNFRHPTTSIRSSAIVLTSGGSLVALSERPTSNKIALLVQKNLYTAAISMAYADPSQSAADIAELYRQYAEHLYDRGDFAAAMEQYISTIGNLEPGHVVLRYLDSAKVPLLVQYLVELRDRGVATREHDELLKTCYAKLGDSESADALTSSGPAASARSDREAFREVQILVNENKSKEALALLCSLDPGAAAKCISSPSLGPDIVHAAPREAAGIVLALCDGSFSPTNLAAAASRGGDAAAGGDSSSNAMPPPLVEGSTTPSAPSGGSGKRFNPRRFTDCFVEQPKLLRLLLATCRERKCHLSADLKRCLLELTLDEWAVGRRRGDSAQERRKRAEVMDILTDPHMEGSDGIEPTDALVLVQEADFGEGITYLYEKLGLRDMLLERLADDGSDSARRSLLAMCSTGDPDTTAKVLEKLVDISCVSGKWQAERGGDAAASTGDALSDLREALFMARAQRAELPPARVARILAGEGSGHFSTPWKVSQPDGPPRGVPLAVALDYIGPVLDGSHAEAARLREELKEYSTLCQEMEEEIEFLRYGKPKRSDQEKEETMESHLKNLRDDIPGMLRRLTEATESLNADDDEMKAEHIREEFFRDIASSKDKSEVVARYFAKGLCP